MSRTRNRDRHQQGIIAVEAAMLLPILLVMLLGLIDFSRLVWTRHVVHEAATQGARMAILAEPSDADVAAHVQAALNEGGIQAAPQVDISTRTPGENVRVAVAVQFEFMALDDLISDMTGVRTIACVSQMRHER